MDDQQKMILEYLENSYTGAKMMGDLETMVRIARAIEAFNLPVDDDCVIESRRTEHTSDENM